MIKKIYFSLVLSIAVCSAFGQSITVPTTIQNVGNVLVSESSDGSFTFSISASGMPASETIWVDATNAQFKVSTTSGSGFASQISFTCDGSGNLALTSVFVEFSPTIKGNTIGYYVDVYDDGWIDYQQIRVRGGGIAPEIQIEGNSTEIINGDDSPSVSDDTDFGSQAYSSGYVDKTFTIKNVAGTTTYDGDLKLNGVSPNFVTISGSADFIIQTQPVSTTLARNGGSATFVVRYDPSSVGTHTATISIDNNDLDEEPYTFDIEGEGAASDPTVTTTLISNILCSTASSGGNITADGGASISARGVCWNTSTDPTIANSKTSDGNGTGAYASSLTALLSETQYYLRAYAINSSGTGYGANEEFWTLSDEPTTQVNNLTSLDKASTTIDLSWNSATGADGYIILIKDGAVAPTNSGVEDAEANASFTLPGGTTVVIETTNTSYQVTGLTASTQYSFTIIPFAKGTNDATYNYKIDGTLATVTESTVMAAPTTQVSGIKWGTTTDNKMEISWTAGNGDGQILLMKQGSAADNPVNGTSYSGDLSFGSGDEIGAGTYVLYRGAGAKGRVFVEDLVAGNSYFFKVLEYSGTGTQTSYNSSETAGYNVGNSSSSGLPIELVSFIAKVNEDGVVELTWTTASEMNNDYYTLEKSVNIKDWDVLSVVNGAGNSNAEITYTSVDDQPIRPETYYRLKQTDFDGTSSYSNIEYVNFEQADNEIAVDLYLSDNNLNVIIYNQAEKNIQIELVNLLGQVVSERNIMPKADNFTTILDMNNYTKGVYLLRVKNEETYSVIKFVKN